VIGKCSSRRVLRIGMSEAELGALILNEKIKEDIMGMTRMDSL